MKLFKLTISILSLSFLFTFYQCSSDEKVNIESGLDITHMDTTVNPGEDFFRFVNGKWVENTEIPPDRDRWGSFDELRKMTSSQVDSILAKAMEDNKINTNSDQGKALVFYKTSMDTEKIEKVGKEPVMPYLDKISGIENEEQLQSVIEEFTPYGMSGLFGFQIFPDLKNSDYNSAYLGSASLGLPDRDYYTKVDEESLRLQGEYKKHMKRMLAFLDNGMDTDEIVNDIYEFEKRLANSMLTKVQKRNMNLMYNKMSTNELSELLPQINWSQYFRNIGVEGLDTIVVTEPAFMKELSASLAELPTGTVKNYMVWNTFNNAAPGLNKDIEDANFDFYGKVMKGTEEMRPRGERMIDQLNGSLGEAMGKLYVDEYFPPEAKAAAEELVDNLLAAFKVRIENLDWMTEETKTKALEKLATFNVKIAYPDTWKDYSDLMVVNSDDHDDAYAQNMLNLNKWNYEDGLKKLGKKVDKNEWFMPPQIVNAYYNPLFNEIVFPAAILQPPFYNYKADAAVNYGGIGAVIGHEISHGFDDAGSRFDANGNLENWWTDEDRAAFSERNQKLIDQFNNYEVLPGVTINGEFTLGENIGDLGGLNTAFDALKKDWEKNGKPGKIDGFTPEQRFFISWATVWRTQIRDDALKTYIKTDPHSPGMYRAFAAPSNMESFYEAFGLNENDKLYRPDSLRVKIW